MSRRGWRVMALRVLSAGVDTVYLSARGRVREDVWPAVEEAKRAAEAAGEAVPFEFQVTAQPFLLRPSGRRGYGYWLMSPDFDLALSRSDRLPAAHVQSHSAYLHSLGPEWALDIVAQLLRLEVFASRPDLVVSRLDLYADVQGFDFQLTDLRRFVCRGRSRRAYDEVFASGRRTTGFLCGRHSILARLYDKTAEIERRGVTWLVDLWGERDVRRPVWRVEFQLRRDALAEFQVETVDDTLAALQDFWRYCTVEWLTLRVPTADRRERRWPLDPLWLDVQAVEIAPTMVGVVRRRLVEANEERVVRGLQGYVTTWAAIRESYQLGRTLDAVGPILARYLASRGRTFEAEVRRKRARMMSVTAPLDGGEEAS